MVKEYCKPQPFLVSRPLVAELNKLPIIKITPQQIINLVCDNFQITKEQLISKSRKRTFTDPRKITTKLILKYLPELSLKEVGGLVNQHYSTIIYNRDNIDSILRTDKWLKDKYKMLLNDIVLIINNG